jgi:hypothetical protein
VNVHPVANIFPPVSEGESDRHAGVEIADAARDQAVDGSVQRVAASDRGVAFRDPELVWRRKRPKAF